MTSSHTNWWHKMTIYKNPNPPLPNPFKNDPFRKLPCGSVFALTGVTAASVLYLWRKYGRHR